ncbi:hypothetical protein PG993_006588 [Apiospora rasikravindrae]|uniref:Uncharacterized protein n=1 Tax=Apiospora rasikravindrae TaxID=990691 RepID=A0ABR1T7W8_9PEZI
MRNMSRRTTKMAHKPLTGCYYTIIGDFHDLKTKPRIVIQPIEGHHAQGVDSSVLAVETIRLERIIQEEIDQINEGRKKDKWFDSQYEWNPQNQVYMQRPDAARPLLIQRPTTLIPKPDQRQEEAKAKAAEETIRKVKSELALRQQEDKQHPTTIRRVRSHEHPLHNHHHNHREHGHKPARGHHSRHVHPTHAHGHQAQPHHHQNQARQREHHLTHGEKSQNQHHQNSNMLQVARPEGLPAQALNANHEPKLGMDDLFPEDDEDLPLLILDAKGAPLGKIPSRIKYVLQHRPTQRPPIHRVHSSKGRLARHNPPRPPVRPILRRTETYVEDLPKPDVKHYGKKTVRFLSSSPHEGDKCGHHTITTRPREREENSVGGGQSETKASDHGDQETPQREVEPSPRHDEATVQSPSPDARPSVACVKTPAQRRSTFAIGPDSPSTDSDSGTPRAAAAAIITDMSAEDQAAGNLQQKQQQTSAASAGQGDGSEHLDIAERLRRDMMAADNEDAVCSSSSCSDVDMKMKMNKGRNRKFQAPLHLQHVPPHLPSSQPNRDINPELPNTPRHKNDEEPKLDIEERMRREMMAKDNEDAVGSSSSCSDVEAKIEWNRKKNRNRFHGPLQLVQPRHSSAQPRSDSPQRLSTTGRNYKGRLELRERLRRDVIPEENETDDEANTEAQAPQQHQHQRQEVSFPPSPPSQPKTASPQQPSATANPGGKEEEDLDTKELLRRAIMGEANAQAVGSYESECDDETPRARPLPPCLQRHQKQRELSGPSSRSKTDKQEDVRQRLLHEISSKGGNAQPNTQEEEEKDEDKGKAAERAIPSCTTAPRASGEGGESKPSSLLTQSFMAQRAAAESTPDHAPAGKIPPHSHQASPAPGRRLAGDPRGRHRGRPRRTRHAGGAAAADAQVAAGDGAPHQDGPPDGPPLRRIEEVDDRRKEAYEKHKREEAEKKRQEEAKKKQGHDKKGKAIAVETNFAVAAAASAAAAAVAGGADRRPRPPPRAYRIGDYISDHRYDYLRSQPLPNSGWSLHW